MGSITSGAKHGVIPRVLLTGPVERAQVPRMLAAMDVASLPQSVDQLGGFRYTTKVSEYLAAGLPILTTQIPLAYDVAGEWAWRLRGDSPWDERFLEALAHLLSTLDHAAVAERRRAVPAMPAEFHEQRQIERVTHFLYDLLEQAGGDRSGCRGPHLRRLMFPPPGSRVPRPGAAWCVRWNFRRFSTWASSD